MWTWRGVQISTDADLLSTMSLIVRAGTTLDAMELIDDYASHLRSDGADDPYRLAQDNLGYLIGYLPRDEGREVYEFFELSHPMLGAEPWNLSNEEILNRGREL